MKYVFLLSVLICAGATLILVSPHKGKAENPRETRPVPVLVEKTATALPLPPPQLHKVATTVAPTPEAPSIRELLKNGQRDAAIARLQEQLKANPTDEVTQLTLAALYAQDGGLRDKAVESLRKLLETNPENREALERYLDLQHDSRKPGNPLETLRRLMEENPDSPNIAGAYARSLGAKGQYADAIALLERAIENPKADELAFNSLSEYYRKIGQPGKAAEAFERAVQRQEELLADRKQRNLPTADLEKSILRSQAMLAGELLQSHQFDRAEDLIRVIAARDPNHPSLKGLRDQLERARSG